VLRSDEPLHPDIEVGPSGRRKFRRMRRYHQKEPAIRIQRNRRKCVKCRRVRSIRFYSMRGKRLCKTCDICRGKCKEPTPVPYHERLARYGKYWGKGDLNPAQKEAAKRAMRKWSTLKKAKYKEKEKERERTRERDSDRWSSRRFLVRRGQNARRPTDSTGKPDADRDTSCVDKRSDEKLNGECSSS
jgi:hypothetical protein